MSEEFKRAGLLLRTVAKILDFIIIAAAIEVIPKAGFFAGIAYLLIGDGLFDGRSLGKKLIGLRVVSADTNTPCTFRDSILRNSTFGIGFLFYKMIWFGWIFIVLLSIFEFIKGKGIVCDEPSVVVIRKDDKKPVAVGAEAKRMLGKTPSNIIAIRPMKDGVIADFDATGEMLKYFITKVHNRRSFVSPRVIIGVPSGITQVEQRAVKAAAQVSGAREVYMIGQPVAAAVGVGLPVGEPSGNMIVDVGGGTPDVAVISLDGVVYSKAVRVGGDRREETMMAS